METNHFNLWVAVCLELVWEVNRFIVTNLVLSSSTTSCNDSRYQEGNCGREETCKVQHYTSLGATIHFTYLNAVCYKDKLLDMSYVSM